MFSNVFKKFSATTQAKLGMLLADVFTDAHDAAQYDSHISSLLDELNIDYQTYTTAPCFDYSDSTLEHWEILVRYTDVWEPLRLPNPFYAPQPVDNVVLPNPSHAKGFLEA